MFLKALRSLCFVLVLWSGIGAANAKDSEHDEAATWARYLAHMVKEPANAKPPDDARFVGRRFFRAESECTANAVALLAANDLLKAAPARWDVSYSPAWNDKLVMRALYHDASGGIFSFVCLLSSGVDLERTRLLIPAPSHDGPVEIIGAQYHYR